MKGNETVMNAEIEIKHKTRLCKVNGKYGIFHLWEEQSDYLAQLNEIHGDTRKEKKK